MSDSVWLVRIETVRDGDERPVLHVSGEVDVQFATDLREAALDVATEGDLAINLSEVSFIDSSGLAALIEVNNALALRGQALVLVAPSRSVRRILELTGLDPVFTTSD